MLKKICGLFLGLVVCAGSACVTPTHASSAFGVVLVHIQSSGLGGAKDELVSIYNNSPNEINITNWCLVNKADVSFACFTSEDTTHAYYLPPYTFAVAVSDTFMQNDSASPEIPTVIFTPSSQSSGSIVNSSDSISLVTADDEIADSFSWSSSIPAGKVAARLQSLAVPYVYETFDPVASWTYQPLIELPQNQVEIRIVEAEVPDDSEISAEPPGHLHPLITEILPNPTGSDTGNEFIELYNPHTDYAVDLSHYALRVGVQLEKSYRLSGILYPFEYVTFNNSEIRFTLLNSSSAVQLEYDGNLVATPIIYSSPKDGQSWALIEDEWNYTTQVTPGGSNAASPEQQNIEERDTTQAKSFKPCAPNQYRSPETNRCRLIATTTSTLKPCTSGQYRSPETNRCRNIAASSTPAPCKAGQERNPETNRCRNIIKMTDAGHAVKGVNTEAATGLNWYLWLVIAGVVLLTLGYGVWEWREELQKIWLRIKAKFAPSK